VLADSRLTAIDSTTYELEVAGEKIELGDKQSLDFKPCAKLSRFDGECSLSIELETIQKIDAVIEGDRLEWKNIDEEIHFYDKGNNEFELEHILLKKPLSNKLAYNLNLENLIAYYQPPLTEEIPEANWHTIIETDVYDKDGKTTVHRPENVIGSYAVYHVAGTNIHHSEANAGKYRAGKAFHIYRPKIKDSAGKEVWGTLNISASTLTIEIDQTFLDAAAYPVYIDPTFGYTSIGATDYSMENELRASLATPAAGMATKMTAYTADNGGGHRVKCALYEKSNSALVKSSNEVTNISNAYAWNDIPFSNQAIMAPVEYMLAIWSEDVGGYSSAIKGDSTSTYHYYQALTYGSWPDPFIGTQGIAAVIYSIYCTYTQGIIFRPTGAGSLTEWASQYPNSTAHWDKVDEVAADDLATYVIGEYDAWKYDLYDITNTIPSGSTINSVGICGRFFGSEAWGEQGKLGFNDGVGTWWSSPFTLTPLSSWVNYDTGLLSTNPRTSSAWTWAQIDALQIGIGQLGIYDAEYDYTSLIYCTQVYVVVDYTEGGGGTVVKDIIQQGLIPFAR